jgi:hypothetical protein
MFKTALSMSLSLCLLAPSFASYGFHFLKTEHIKQHAPKKTSMTPSSSIPKPSIASNGLNYTDFSGEWTGTCSFSDDDYQYATNITITNNYASFTLSDDEGFKETYYTDALSSSSENGTTHNLKHKIARWIDDNNKLIFSEMYIESNPVDAQFSTEMLETTFSLESNQLIVHNETHSFFGAVQYRDYSVHCGFSKKA